MAVGSNQHCIALADGSILALLDWFGSTSFAVAGSILGVGPCGDVEGLLLVVPVVEIGDTVGHSDFVGSIAEVVPGVCGGQA